MEIFVSYSHINGAIVEQWVVQTLRSAGYEVWFDTHITGGQNWKQKLKGNIDNCEIFIFCMSPTSVKSRWCNWEFNRAKKLEKFIIPVLLQSDTLIPKKMESYQHIDFSKGATSELVKAVNIYFKARNNSTTSPVNPITTTKPMLDMWFKPEVIIGIIGLFLTIIGLVIANSSNSNTDISSSTATDTVSATYTPIDETNIIANQNSPEAQTTTTAITISTSTPTPSHTSNPKEPPTATNTLTQTVPLIITPTDVAVENTTTWTPIPTQTLNATTIPSMTPTEPITLSPTFTETASLTPTATETAIVSCPADQKEGSICIPAGTYSMPTDGIRIEINGQIVTEIAIPEPFWIYNSLINHIEFNQFLVNIPDEPLPDNSPLGEARIYAEPRTYRRAEEYCQKDNISHALPSPEQLIVAGIQFGLFDEFWIQEGVHREWTSETDGDTAIVIILDSANDLVTKRAFSRSNRSGEPVYFRCVEGN